MGDVISSHLDESRRQNIQERTGKLLAEFGKIYEEQYGVALFNSVRYEIEGNGGPQTQLLHRKTPLKDRVIFSGNLFQYLEDTRKWRNRFCLVPHHYGPLIYENKVSYERGLQPRAGINCAGYRVLTSLEQYTDLLNNTIPGGKVKAGSAQMKCATQFPVILWHPHCRHYNFCVMTEQEQQRWSAVFQDCVRHCNNGIPEDSRVESAAFTDSVRLFRQARDQYGTWDMLCGNQVQVLSNLVMDELIPDLKNIISPKLRGKPQDRQRTWLLISDTVYRMVHEQTRLFYEALEKRCGEQRAQMESQIRTDMDQIIACKEHVFSKIRASVLPKAELCVRNHVQSHIPSILDALMIPTSQGFSEVRELIFTEATDMNKNLVNEGGRDKLGEHMEKLSQLAYHPLKMQQCYEKMDHLNLEGLQQRFDVGSPSVFKQRAQILMRELTDNAVYTFEHLIHQELGKAEGGENLCRDIQRILERVLKKYDYDSSSVRKKFFQEALLQIIIPFLLKKLAPTCRAELPRYQELIFEELSRFVLVENTYEEVVLQSVMRDIVQAVKEAAIQRKHNLFRDSVVMNNSDPNLHLLGDGSPINWTEDYSNNTESSGGRNGRLRQVVSIIQDDDAPEYLESCQEAPTNEDIPEEPAPSHIGKIRAMLVKEFDVEVPVSDQEKTQEHALPEEQATHITQSQHEHMRPSEFQEAQEEDYTSPGGHYEDAVDHSHAQEITAHGSVPVNAEVTPDTKLVQDDHETSHLVGQNVHKVEEELSYHPPTKENLTTDGLSLVQETHHEVLENKAAHHDLEDHKNKTAHHDLEDHKNKTVHHDLEDHENKAALHDLEVHHENKAAYHDLEVHHENKAAHYDLEVNHENKVVHRDLNVEPENKATHYDSELDHENKAAHHDSELDHENKAAHHDLEVDHGSGQHHVLEEHSSPEKMVHPQILPCEMQQEDPITTITPSEEETHPEVLQSPTSHVVQSTPDDSGFQSPMSEEEEEGDRYRKIPVLSPQNKDDVITKF